MWAGEGSTAYARQIIQPALYDLKIQNPIYGYGGILSSNAEESRNGATQSATLSGIVTNNSNQLSLAPYLNYPSSTGSAEVIIASASADLGAIPGTGAHTLQLPNGNFLVITASANVTRMYNPNTGLFSAGPTLCGSPGAGSFSLQLPDGRFLTLLGGTINTCIYDPISNTFTSGPSLSSAGNIGAGAQAIQRPDGKYLVFRGGNTTITDIFDPWSMSFTPGPYTPAASIVGAGAVSMRRPDGRYVTLVGGAVAVASQAIIYDPTTNQFQANTGNASVTTSTGSTAVQLSSGKFFIPRSSGATSQIYDPALMSLAPDRPTSGSDRFSDNSFTRRQGFDIGNRRLHFANL